MAGLAGESIGLGAAEMTNIAPTQTMTDGTTSARGCTVCFIGFGLGLTSEPTTEDFNAIDDAVTLAISGGAEYDPTYTNGVLSWVDNTP